MADNSSSAAFDAAFDASPSASASASDVVRTSRASLDLPSESSLLLGGGGGGGADMNVNNTSPSNLNSDNSMSVLVDPLSFPHDNAPPANPPLQAGGFMFASPSPFQAGSLGEGGGGGDGDGLSALEECAALGTSGRLVTSGGEEHASQRERLTGTSAEEPRTPNNMANSAPSSMANLQHGGTRLYSSADEEPQSNNTSNNNNNGETTPHKIPTVPYGTINARSPCAFQPAAPYARTTGVWFPNRERLRCALQTAADNMFKHSCDDCDKRPWTEEEAQLRCALEENIYARGHEHNSTLDALTALVEWLNQNNLSREAVDVARTVALRL